MASIIFVNSSCNISALCCIVPSIEYGKISLVPTACARITLSNRTFLPVLVDTINTDLLQVINFSKLSTPNQWLNHHPHFSNNPNTTPPPLSLSPHNTYCKSSSYVHIHTGGHPAYLIPISILHPPPPLEYYSNHQA